VTHRASDDSALAIVKRIRGGDFRMDDSAWRNVSAPAKALVRGMLTVDAASRITLEDLCRSSWLRCPAHSALVTPLVLSEHPLAAKRSIMMTFNAFRQSTSSSKHHRTKTADSCYSSSGCSSMVSSPSHSLSPTKQLAPHQQPWAFPAVEDFFANARVQEYLKSLSAMQTRPADALTGVSLRCVASAATTDVAAAVSIIPVSAATSASKRAERKRKAAAAANSRGVYSGVSITPIVEGPTSAKRVSSVAPSSAATISVTARVTASASSSSACSVTILPASAASSPMASPAASPRLPMAASSTSARAVTIFIS
jgi:hypothetical protein